MQHNIREPRKGDSPRLSGAQSFYVICGVIRSLGAQASAQIVREPDTIYRTVGGTTFGKEIAAVVSCDAICII